jgi:hypothetical protein
MAEAFEQGRPLDRCFHRSAYPLAANTAVIVK